MNKNLSIKIRKLLFLFAVLATLLLVVLPLGSLAVDTGFGLTGAIRKKVKKIDEKVRQEKEKQQETDTTPPVISDVSASVFVSSATITWQTNELSTSQVEYGITTDYGSAAENTQLKTNHSILLSTLLENTTYYYRVNSRDAAGNTATGSGLYFVTNSYVTETSEQIIVDQFGWRADSKKVVIFANPIEGQNSTIEYTPANTFEIKRSSDDVTVYSGNTTVWENGATHADSGDKAWHGDFSDFNTPGEYYIYDASNNLRSYSFKVDNDLYNDLLVSSLRVFYYQRCGAAITSEYGGNWIHNLCHSNDQTAQLYYNGVEGNPKDLSGGWHDAGGLNKYIPLLSDAIFPLLMSYEINPDVYGDNNNIPESGNGVPDILDEIKWETDWMLKMQDENGAVHTKTYMFWDEVNIDQDNNPRYYTKTSTWATASFAACLAHASRVFDANTEFGSEYPGYASVLLTAAENAWAYLSANPEMTPDTGSLESGDEKLTADSNLDKRFRIWAAAELFNTTNDDSYDTYFKANYNDISGTSQYGHHPLSPSTNYFHFKSANDLNKAYIVYIQSSGADSSIVTELKQSLRNAVDNMVTIYNNETDPYIAEGGWISWGSNYFKALLADLLIYAIELNINPSSNAIYKELGEEYIHYFHGRNPLSYTYLTNMGPKGANLGGDKCSMGIFHLWFMTSDLYEDKDSTYGPAPGYLISGPNANEQSFTDIGADPPSPPKDEPPLKAYIDGRFDGFVAVSEPFIQVQATYQLLLAYYCTQ